MDKRRVILDAAAEAFYEKGFHGVGMDELGARAGTSGPSIYRHVAGKGEILATLLNEAMDELQGAAAPVLDDPAADLERALRHHVEFALAHRHLVTVHQREVGALPPPWRAPFDQRRRAYADQWTALVARRFPALDGARAAAAAQACLGLVFSVPGWPARVAQDPSLELPALLLALLEGGLGALEARPANR